MVTDDPLEHYELVFLLGLAWQQLLTAFTDRLTEAGYGDLRPVHGFALQLVAQSDDVTSSQLGDALALTKQAAGQLVGHLVNAGYVVREAHPLGGRRRRIALTARGSLHLHDAGNMLREIESQICAPLSTPAVSQLRDGLITLIRGRITAPAVPPLRPVW